MTSNTKVLTQQEICTIAKEAYTYGYPLVLMYYTMLVRTNVARPDTSGHAPVNQVGRVRTFPDDTFKDVVKPNVDTLYTMAWMDLSKEPMVLNVPDIDRYYLLPLLDAYSNVFESPGTRTSGSYAQQFLIAGPNWEGMTPDALTKLTSPTNMVWMLGRIKADSSEDCYAVWPIQQDITLVPLSKWNKKYHPPKGTVNPDYSTIEPVEAVKDLSFDDFINLMTNLMEDNPANMPQDLEIIEKMKSIGIEAGKSFSSKMFDPKTRLELATIPNHILGYWEKEMPKILLKERAFQNKWVSILEDIGTFGDNYLQRAYIAYKGLGANIVEDAFYPNVEMDNDGEPLVGGKSYKITFEEGQTPPVHEEAFWSLTAYDATNLLVENPIDRFALRGTDLKVNDDGTTDIYIQPNDPGGDLTANWLPSPTSDSMSLTMRLYWPTEKALNPSEWKLPPVMKNETT